MNAVRFDWRDDRGQLAGIEVLPFGVLIFVVGALLITNAWAVVDAKIAVDAASREAVRTYVEAPDGNTALTAARAAADDTIAAHGRRPELASVTVHHDGDRPFGRCVARHRRGRLPGPGAAPALDRRLRPRLRRPGPPHRAHRPLPIRAPRCLDVLTTGRPRLAAVIGAACSC